MNDPTLADAIRATAARIGANPVDLATAMSYETGGTFDPAIRGGAGNRHVGLIQFGIPEQQRYGVGQQTPAAQQVDAAGRFLVDRGFRPGMGLADLYSAINAGRVGLYNRSDAGNGGAPGTVMDKVTQQMGGHRQKAAALLGEVSTPAAPVAVPGQAPQAGTTLADALPGATLPSLNTVAAPVSDGPDPARQAEQERQVRAQRAQVEQQRKQALLSVSAFYR